MDSFGCYYFNSGIKLRDGNIFIAEKKQEKDIENDSIWYTSHNYLVNPRLDWRDCHINKTRNTGYVFQSFDDHTLMKIGSMYLKIIKY